MKSGRLSRAVLRAAFPGAVLVGAVLAGCAPGGGTATPEAPPDIYLVVVDTWRWDTLGANLGSSRGDSGSDLTPHLDRLAERGVRFARAFAPSPWTQPSVASMLTGVHPTVHGGFGRLADVAPIRLGVPLVSERLSAAGYHTLAVVNGFFLSPKLGFERGFAIFDYFASSNLDVRRAGPTVDVALNHLREAAPGPPVFAFVHLFDPHLAYDPPPPFAVASPTYEAPFKDLRGMRLGTLDRDPEHLAHVRRLYEGEVAYVDRELGRLLESLEAVRPGRERLIIVTADHGEELGDHQGWEHGHAMYRELLQVPLLVVPPASRPPTVGVVEAQVRLIDLMPTMLDAAGLPLPEEGIAKSLFPWFESEARRDDLTAYGERVHLGRASVALRDGRYALIHYPDEDRFELYDQRLDPLERRDLAALEPERVEALARRLGRIQRTLAERARRVEGPDEEIDLTPEEMEKLEALGYVGG